MYKRFENIFLAVFWFLALALGFWGFARAGSLYHVADPRVVFDPAAATSLYHHDGGWIEAVRCMLSAIGLIRMYDLYLPRYDPWQLIVAQFAVPGVALLSAVQLFLAGVRKNIRTALARHKTHHTIVCGIGAVGLQVVQNLRGARHRVVAIDLVGDSPGAGTCESSGVPVVQGDAKSPQVLLSSGIRHAQTAVVCTGSDSENIAIALQIKAVHERRSYFKPAPIQVLAEVRNDWMYKRLLGSGGGSLGSADVDVRLFNPFTTAARMLIGQLHLPPAPEFEARTFLIAGFGAYGREFALHLVRSFPVILGGKLKILVIDEHAAEAGESFPLANPIASELAAFEFVDAVVAPGSPDMQRIVSATLASSGPLLGAALALGDDEVSLCAGLELRSLLDHTGHLHTPVYVRLEHYRQLGELVHNIERIACFGDRLQIFGTLEETLNEEVLFGSALDRFAQALHDDYRRRSQEQINPQANVPWHELPEFMKLSNRWRADHSPLLLELAGIRPVRGQMPAASAPLNPGQIELLAQLEHRRYTIERGMLLRRDPHIKSWDLLSENDKNWNRNEVARLPEIMASVGIQLHPIHTARLYGPHLQPAIQELEQLPAGAKSEHVCLIADLDESAAVSAAARFLNLPSLSLWLFSREQPAEFLGRKTHARHTDREALLHRANGWAHRDRLALLA